jgi:hypothetical protein
VEAAAEASATKSGADFSRGRARHSARSITRSRNRSNTLSISLHHNTAQIEITNTTAQHNSPPHHTRTCSLCARSVRARRGMRGRPSVWRPATDRRRAALCSAVKVWIKCVAICRECAPYPNDQTKGTANHNEKRGFKVWGRVLMIPQTCRRLAMPEHNRTKK